MRHKHRRPGPPAPLMPPELLEGEAYVYSTHTDGEGRLVYVILGEEILKHSGLPRPSPRHRLHYKDGDKLNNLMSNLEWRLRPPNS